MKILVDRHHADLLNSIQCLFEDRLGVEVFVPVGHEWWDEGYWRFGQVYGDDRLAQQYLALNDSYIATQGGQHYVTHDQEHPDRKIRAVTLEQFRAKEWAFVMPSVQENQLGFHRLAKEVGARYLYQVGNTGQQIEWALDPFVVNTSEAPLRGQGITIHQEIASGPAGAYRFSEAEHANRHLIRNFVNLFDRLPGYEAFLAAERTLTDFTFKCHGHEGRDEYLPTAGEIGAAMAGSGFAWHDKPVGDGFGHVIHSWAAVGRPLIGHARYYRGKQAGPLWRDGVTCIDLDVHAMPEVYQSIRNIANDPERHKWMCDSIRAEFDTLVNYEAEADAVRSLLGL